MDNLKYFDQIAPIWDATLMDGNSWVNHQEAFRRFHWFLKRTLKIGNRTKSFRLLDLGCGTGEASWPLWKRVQSVTFFDRSAQMLRLARNKYPKGIFVRGKAEDLPFLNEEFDVIVSRGGVLSQLDAQGGIEMLESVWRVLRPNGYFLFDFVTPNDKMGDMKANGGFQSSYNRRGMERLINKLLPGAAILACDGTDAHTFNRMLIKKTA